MAQYACMEDLDSIMKRVSTAQFEQMNKIEIHVFSGRPIKPWMTGIDMNLENLLVEHHQNVIKKHLHTVFISIQVGQGSWNQEKRHWQIIYFLLISVDWK